MKKYKVEGLSCTNCSAKFEGKVAQIETVQSAQVNFGAGILTVEGNASLDELTEAGKFENLIIKEYNDNSKSNSKSFIHNNMKIIISLFLIVSAVLLDINNLSYSSLFFISAIIIGGFSLFKEGLSDIIKLNFSMQALMTIAITGACIIGEWAEGSIVVILFALSEVLEKYSMDKARKSITSLMNIAPKTAIIIREGKEIEVRVENIKVKDIMIVKPGQQISMDGVIIEGSSSVNQSAITGESLPVTKDVGDDVFAGTLNTEGLLKVEVLKLVEDTTISKIINMVEEAQNEKAPSQNFVDSFSKIYTPMILFLSLLVVILPPLLFNWNWSDSFYQGISLLVVGCPCSLVISTPVSIVSSISNAAQKGVLIKGGIHLEEMGRLKAVAFDKTGTLTQGFPEVTDVYGDETYIAHIAALENYSQHPLARALISKSINDGLDYTSFEVSEFESFTGMGIRGKINSVMYYIGSPALFSKHLLINEIDLNLISKLQEEGKTVVIFGTDNVVLTMVAISDTIRKNGKNVISNLKETGIEHVVMLTGDDQKTANAIASELGIEDVYGDLMPEGKLKAIKSLKEKYGNVGMVGDGVNDAPALALASVGITMGGAGTDTALETADVVLMSDDLSKLPFTIRLSRKTLKIIKQNIFLSLIVKVIAVLLIIPGWLSLWLAIVADMGATLFVTVNGMRLMRVK
ncbi:MAG: heavy metal translocating P-type ATPase [Erysipelothrix sp.]